MPRLTWDNAGEKYYESGVSNGVLYPFDPTNRQYAKGVAWNGLISVNENAEGGDAEALWADNIKYLNIPSREEFNPEISCYTYPEEFEACDGSAAIMVGQSGQTPTNSGVYLAQQKRIPFCLVYRTEIGNDLDEEAGYKLHICYNLLASPSSKDRQTQKDSPEVLEFSYSCTSTPEKVAGYKPTAHIIIDSRRIASDKLTSIENALLGTDGTGSETGTDPRILMPADLLTLLGVTQG